MKASVLCRRIEGLHQGMEHYFQWQHKSPLNMVVVALKIYYFQRSFHFLALKIYILAVLEIDELDLKENGQNYI